MNHPPLLPGIVDPIEFARFDPHYIYGGTSSYVAMQKLLNRNERERLIGAGSLEAAETVLKETFLGKYLHADSNVESALQASLKSVKHSLEQSVPTKHLTNILFLRYDFYNLKVLLKLPKEALDDPETTSRLSPLGLHSAQTLIKAVVTKNTADLHPELASALSAAEKEAKQLDNYLECRYLLAARGEAEASGKKFALRYVTLLTNLFAIIAGLRSHARGMEAPHPEFLPFSLKELTDPEALLKRLSRIGWSKHWSDAVTLYREEKDFSILDKAMDDFIMKWIKRQAIQIDSAAPYFAYWHVMRENVAFVRAVMTAHKVGLPEKTLRNIIRTSYSAYVY